ncbi:MAG: hypothetical protein AAGA59_05255 [Actinomycetota bacterium]
MAETRTEPSADGRSRALPLWGGVFIATWLVHTGDHIRRTTASTSDGVIWAGTFAAVAAAVALTLIFTGHPLAPFAAASVFTSIAVGVTATHLAPSWGYFSEPLLFDSATDRWALVAAMPEILVAAWLGWLGFRIVRAQNFQLVERRPHRAAGPKGR